MEFEPACGNEGGLEIIDDFCVDIECFCVCVDIDDMED